jgi:hypothetical protein
MTTSMYPPHEPGMGQNAGETIVLPGAVLVLQAESQMVENGLYLPHLLETPVFSQLSAGTLTGLDVQQRYPNL